MNTMKDVLETPKISEILLEEFMQPLEISAYKLAKNINMPTSRIQDILKDKRKITIDTSIRLTRYFNEIDKYFLNLQNDINICNALLSMNNELGNIKRFYKLEEFIK